MENEKQIIYLADWLDKAMGNKKRFHYKMPSFKYSFLFGFAAVMILYRGVDKYYSVQCFNLLFYAILMIVFMSSYIFTYNLVKDCSVRKREKKYVFVALVKKRYLNEVGVSREYFALIWVSITIFIILAIALFRIYRYGVLMLFAPVTSFNIYLWFAAMLLCFSQLAEFIAFIVKLFIKQ